DITGFSAILAPGQAWVFDTVHKGNPDENREMVVAGTTEFIFEFWRQVSSRLTGSEAQLRKMRAYVMGHLCHLAGDIVSHPMINDLEWHASTAPQGKLTHSDGEVSHDAMVAQTIFRRASTREGAAWDDWWPTLDDVPSEFFDSYAQAFEQIYRAVARRRTGFGEFEERFADLAPPLPTADFVRDGYRMYRKGIIPFGYGFGAWMWFVVLMPLSLPMMTMPLLALGPEKSRMLFLKKDLGADSDRAWCEMVSISLFVGSVSALVYQAWVGSLTMHGVKTGSILGIVLQSIQIVLGIVFLATLSTDMPPWLRWLLFAIVPGAVVVAQLIKFIVDVARKHYKRRSALAALYCFPPILMVVSALLGLAFSRILLAIEDSDELHPGLFALAVVLNSVGWFVTFFVIARHVLRDAKIPEYPQFDQTKPHHVRLFDDATQFFDQGSFRASDYPGGTAPKMIGRFYPSGQRKLLKLWWEGDGDLWVRVDRYKLHFSTDEAGQVNPQEVSAPIGPTTLAEFALYLTATVKDTGGQTGKLKASVLFPNDLDYELPPGAVFADHGDFEEKLADHDKEAGKSRKLGKDPESDYILYHAPKPAQAIRFGRTGPVLSVRETDETAIRTSEDATGYQYVYNPVNTDADGTLMRNAADFAALLCMGAVPHLETGVPEGDRVFQVFRNWSLDRRRVNEWRMLVAGGAFSEKGADLNKVDPAMLQPSNPSGWTTKMSGDALAEGERTAREMGWVSLLREWLDMARRPTVDSLADERLKAENPTNRAMSRAMAFLFDMAEPANAP
ncbi:MAG TPA: hypothetical protein VMS96_05540, partial [Terriglobales bacterium]|nr:hypothetical protein [Terriglobales bacterium]